MAEVGTDEGIAIIGLGGRFPGARNIAEFWQNLRDGVESISSFTDEELLSAGVDPAALSDPSYIKAGGVIKDIELFDAAFFGFSPREAEILDPQQRLFLECAWETLEQAGYDPETYPGLIGVYAGVGMSTYLLNLYSNRELMDLMGEFQVLLGNDKDHLTTYVSYKLNLKGPSLAVQTACSTSLVAVCLACQSLLSYQCDMALAGGVSITVPQTVGYLYQDGGTGSPDGHCRAFDAAARGTVGGNGLGVVVLKRLADALADGDCIHAIIKGSAINNDGSLKIGYTAPSVDGQAEVVALAQALAGIGPETITYIEAHGTATPLGDPIEIAALTQAFRAKTKKKGFCAIGSVKTNIGHLDPAAGIAGLIKTVLALKHKLLPPSLYFQSPNPKIDFANSPFYVNTQLAEWRTGGWPRRAGVSSFGIGGTNAHVVLEEAPPLESTGPASSQQLLVLSAKTSSALETATTNLVEHLKQQPDLNLADVAYTLQVGRKAFPHRRILVCQNLAEAVSALETRAPGRVATAFGETKERPVAFMFSGQGAQYVEMARELYQFEPTFRQQVEHCSELLRPHLGLDLREVLYPSAEQAETARQQLQQTALAQPALFVIEYALAKLWMKWGVRPQAMIGHSIGEYVAACLAGVFTLEEALALVATRGRLMQQMPTGAMLAVPVSMQEAQTLLDGSLSLAAINAPSLCVLSGPSEAVAQLEGRLTEQGLACHRLHTSHAFHSGMMEPVLEAFAAQVSHVNLKPPQIPYVSNLTGKWITAAEATDPRYWARHLRQTVRFAEGLELLLAEPDRILLEVGPGQTLTTLAKQCVGKETQQLALASLRRPQERQSDESLLLQSLGQLWLAGLRIDWSGFHQHERRLRLPLPTYPFERRRYWIERQESDETATYLTTSQAASQVAYSVSAHKQKQADIADWFYFPSWKRSAPPEFFQSEELLEQQSDWLVFSDACGLGSRLVARLEQSGQEVTSVVTGAQFTKLGEQSYAIDPRRQSDYATLFKELRTLGKTPHRIVHLWSVTPDNQPTAGIESNEKFQELGFNSLIFLAQALGDQNLPERLPIGVVSNQVQAVTGEESLCPAKATLLGPCMVIPEEYPQLTCRSIDVVIPPDGSRSMERLIDQLIAELTAETADLTVAYRGTHRWVRMLEPLRLAETTQAPPCLREGGVYLITGGLGGIGLVLAEYLAQTVRAKLVLLGRSPFPERAEWQAWLAAHAEQEAISRRIRKAQALEALGSEVMIISADVADPAAMQQALDQVTERFGKLHGVIHSAGVAGGRMIQLQSPETAARVLAPKVKGTLVLDALLKDEELDFLVLCSSLNSLEGSLGQADYCGANAFLDAYAHSQADTGRFVTSINWDAWQEVGMAVETAVPRDLAALRAADLEQAILSIEGKEAFARILSAPLPQIAVSTTRLQGEAESYPGYVATSVQEEAQAAELAAPRHDRPLLTAAYVAATNQTERTITAMWQDLLGVEPIGIHDNFFELGGHSLLAVQFISRLREAFQIEMTVQHLFDAQTVAAIAERVEQTRQTDETELGRLDELLSFVEQLSEDQIRELLAAENSIQE